MVAIEICAGVAGSNRTRNSVGIGYGKHHLRSIAADKDVYYALAADGYVLIKTACSRIYRTANKRIFSVDFYRYVVEHRRITTPLSV